MTPMFKYLFPTRQNRLSASATPQTSPSDNRQRFELLMAVYGGSLMIRDLLISTNRTTTVEEIARKSGISIIEKDVQTGFEASLLFGKNDIFIILNPGLSAYMRTIYVALALDALVDPLSPVDTLGTYHFNMRDHKNGLQFVPRGEPARDIMPIAKTQMDRAISYIVPGKVVALAKKRAPTPQDAAQWISEDFGISLGLATILLS
jgi:hypothetical protein